MWWLRLPAACVALSLAALPAVPVMADTATADLIAAPPSSSWQVDPQSGAMTRQDIYGAQAGQVQQFVDAYRSVWTTQAPRQIMADRLERYTSAFWAAFRYGESHGASKKNKQHTSVTDVSGFGPNAYEITDPADANGFLIDTIVFQQGDYLGVISLYDMTQPDKVTLLDQTTRQYNLIPVPVSEYNSLGHGIAVTVVIVALAALAIALIIGVIVLVTTRRRRRPQPTALNLSADRRYWWDGQSWQDTAVRMPAGAPLSPDGAQWWDGVAWRPRPPG